MGKPLLKRSDKKIFFGIQTQGPSTSTFSKPNFLVIKNQQFYRKAFLKNVQNDNSINLRINDPSDNFKIKKIPQQQKHPSKELSNSIISLKFYGSVIQKLKQIWRKKNRRRREKTL